MLRYFFYVVAVFLLADHLYTHWGPEVINWVASRFLGEEITVVDEPPHRKSSLDRVMDKVKELWR